MGAIHDVTLNAVATQSSSPSLICTKEFAKHNFLAWIYNMNKLSTVITILW